MPAPPVALILFAANLAGMAAPAAAGPFDQFIGFGSSSVVRASSYAERVREILFKA